MMKFNETTEKVAKTREGITVPDYLVGKVELLRCNSTFLSDLLSVGVKAGKSYQVDAIKKVLKWR